MAMVITLAMMLGMMSLSAFAADETHTISLNSNDTHTYKVFQVLTGTLSEEGSQELGNPAWGADAIAEPGDVNDFITAITAEGITEREIAALVATKVDTSGNGQGTVDKDTPLEGLATGYYVLVDVTELEEGEELSLNVVKVVNDVEGFTVKYDTVTDEKIITTDIKTVLTVAETFTEEAEGDYYKLKNGKYTKEAPSDAQSMVPAEDGATEGYVEDADATGDDVITIGEKKYRPYVPAEDENMTVYTLVNGTSDQYESTTTKYKKTVTKTAQDVKENHKIAVTVDDNGLARFDGLGAGEYTISETQTPSGYNTLADMTVTVSFDDTATPKWSFTTGTYDSTEGIDKIEIENNKGTELPETGGIGTTIFYIVGMILVIGAGVVLITRRRMDS